jgi:head-tail adaptor
VDAAGDPAQTWTTVGSVWASVEPVSLTRMSGARDAVAAGANTATDIRHVELYPYPGIEPLTWRFVMDDGRIYDLKASRPSNDGFKLAFLATLGTAD